MEQPRLDAQSMAERQPADKDGDPHARADRRPTGRLVSDDDSASRRSPAVGRAMQVQTAVRLENATGQAPSAEVFLANTAPSSAGPTATASALQDLQAQPAATGPSSSAEPDGNHFAARVLRGLSAMVNQRGGVMTMRLEPPELGRLRVEMSIARGVVTAQFHATTAEAQALLERSIAVLRSALEAHGLTVDRLTVHATQPTGSQAMRQDSADEQPHHQRNHTDAGQGESRGRRDGDPSASHRRFALPSEGDFKTFNIPQPAGRS